MNRNDSKNFIICLKTIVNYQNTTEENLLGEQQNDQIIQSNIEHFNFSKKNSSYYKNKSSIFGNFYRQEKDKMNNNNLNKNNSVNSLPKIKYKFEYLKNKINKNRNNLYKSQKKINDDNLDDKTKSLNPIFLTELFKSFDKKSKFGIFKKKIRILHNILLTLTFLFLLFEGIINLKIRKLNDNIINEGNKKGLSYIENLNNLKKRQCSKLENTFRILNLINVIVSEFLLIKREIYFYQYHFNIISLKNRIMDFIIVGIFFPPFLNIVYIIDNSEIKYPLIFSNYFYILSLSKIILFLKYNNEYNKWNNVISQNISKTLSAKTGHLFVLQCRIKESSFIYLIIILIVMIFFFTILFRNAEYLSLNINLPFKKNKELYFDSIIDTLWTSIMISFGITYGDIFPKTPIGKLIAIINTIVGYIIISKLIITFIIYLKLDESENKVFLKMKRLNSPENKYLKAIKVIRDLFLIRKFLIKKNKEFENKIQKIEAVKHISILLLSLNNNMKNFMDDEKIDESYTIPVDDVVKELMNKIEENLKCFQIFFNKLDNLNEQLKELMDIQNTINFNLQESIKHQKIILKYLIDLNNEAKIEKLKKKFFNKRYSSNQTKNSKKNEELFLSNKQFSEALKLKLTHTYKSNYIHSDEDFITKRNDNFQLNYNGFKIIKENNVEESNISNFSLLKKMSINKISNKSSPGKNGN